MAVEKKTNKAAKSKPTMPQRVNPQAAGALERTASEAIKAKPKKPLVIALDRWENEGGTT